MRVKSISQLHKECDIHNNLQKSRDETQNQLRRSYIQSQRTNIDTDDNNQFLPLNACQTHVKSPDNQQTSFSQILRHNQ